MAVALNDSVDWKVTQGDSFQLQLEYQDENGDPINLGGYSIQMEVKDQPGGTITSAVCSIGNGITVPNPSTGTIMINVSPTKTKNFNYPRASYQIQITSPGNTKTTLLQGWFLVNAGVIN